MFFSSHSSHDYSLSLNYRSFSNEHFLPLVHLLLNVNPLILLRRLKTWIHWWAQNTYLEDCWFFIILMIHLLLSKLLVIFIGTFPITDQDSDPKPSLKHSLLENDNWDLFCVLFLVIAQFFVGTLIALIISKTIVV